jgi:hypothetical protein
MPTSSATDSGVPLRRSVTAPLRGFGPERRNSTAKEPPNVSSEDGKEFLFLHPSAKIVKFAPPPPPAESQQAPKSSDFDYPVDTIETLPWRSSTEQTVAVGTLKLEKLPNQTNFLKCGSVVRPILKNSQCWCVDGESTFVLRIRPLTYYRIELPSETEEDRTLVNQFKDALQRILRYEATPCPFQRGFSVEIPEEARVPRKKKAWQPKDRRESAPVGSFSLTDWNSIGYPDEEKERPSSAGNPSIDSAEASTPMKKNVLIQNDVEDSVYASSGESKPPAISSPQKSLSNWSFADGSQKFDTVLATFHPIPESDDEEKMTYNTRLDTTNSTQTPRLSSPSSPSTVSQHSWSWRRENTDHNLNNPGRSLEGNLHNDSEDRNLKDNYNNCPYTNRNKNLDPDFTDNLDEDIDINLGRKPNDLQDVNEFQINCEPSNTSISSTAISSTEKEPIRETDTEIVASGPAYKALSFKPIASLRGSPDITSVSDSVAKSSHPESPLETKSNPHCASASASADINSTLNGKGILATPIWHGTNVPDVVSTSVDTLSAKYISNDAPLKPRRPPISRHRDISPASHPSIATYPAVVKAEDKPTLDFRRLIILMLLPPLRLLLLIIQMIVKIALSSPSDLMQSLSNPQQPMTENVRTRYEETDVDFQDDFGIPLIPRSSYVRTHRLDVESDSASER